jgi:hypothetical protein
MHSFIPPLAPFPFLLHVFSAIDAFAYSRGYQGISFLPFCLLLARIFSDMPIATNFLTDPELATTVARFRLFAAKGGATQVGLGRCLVWAVLHIS